MGQPQGQFPMDPGNVFVDKVVLPANLTLTQVGTDQGQRVLATVRCGGTTLSVLLSRDEAAEWGNLLLKMSSATSSLIVPTNGSVVDLSHDGRVR